MGIVVWIVTILVAIVFLLAGLAQLTRSQAELKAIGMEFVEDFSAPCVRALGALEIAAAVGLILPGLTGVLPILVPLSAFGLALVMAGAIVVHIRRNEYAQLGKNLVLLALTLFVAICRLGPVPFGI
ncbi:MAG: DoxX family protein [Actinobacteria bacterium]|nr:DoxX family protein [Actinomycetota bacterium]